MFLWKSRDVRPFGPGAPSSLLSHVAGDFAAQVAGVWPDPHAVFLTAPAARRHLVCLAFACAEPGAAVDADAILHRALKRAIRHALPAGRAAPEGLARALARMGETAGRAGDYRALLDLLAGRQTGKLLRHRERIEVGEVRALARLPAPLLDQGLGRLGLHEAGAGLVADAWLAIQRRDGEALALAAAARWSAAETLQGLVEAAQIDLELEPPAPPHPGTERLRPLATKAALLDAATRFRNCLRNHMASAADGTSAYYEWVEPPGAVLEITRDRLFGWALEQARLAGNKPVPEPARGAIIQDLRSMGVHVGRVSWQLRDGLYNLAYSPSEPVANEAAAIGELFGD